MSPPNSKYGEEVTKLRTSLYQSIVKDKNHRRTLTLGDFLTRLSDVWKAVKAESFVFTFRNSEAIKIYAEMRNFFYMKSDSMRVFISNGFSTATESLLDDPTIKDLGFAKTKLNDSLAQHNLYQKIEMEKRKVFAEFDELVKNSANPEIAAKGGLTKKQQNILSFL